MGKTRGGEEIMARGCVCFPKKVVPLQVGEERLNFPAFGAPSAKAPILPLKWYIVNCLIVNQNDDS